MKRTPKVRSERAPEYQSGAASEVKPSTLRSIRGPEDVQVECGWLAEERREHFMVVMLNGRHECIKVETISIGSLNASIVHPREVFRAVILASAASIILVHNHPSGDPEPSEEDITITKRLVKCGEMLGIAVLDHVIIASRGFIGLRARGLMEGN